MDRPVGAFLPRNSRGCQGNSHGMKGIGVRRRRGVQVFPFASWVWRKV
jgi:hypothetical protein